MTGALETLWAAPAGEGVPGVDQALAWVEARRAKPAPRPEARI